MACVRSAAGATQLSAHSRWAAPRLSILRGANIWSELLRPQLLRQFRVAASDIVDSDIEGNSIA
jgi:hypothetical protein